jgi:beta-glucosidase
VFLGDSISDFWQSVGASSWSGQIAPMHVANLGIAGNTTANVLWQVDSGELAGRPKVVVLEVGTNNLGLLHQSPTEVAAGIAADVAAIRAASPGSQVVLMGLFPRGTGGTDLLTREAAAVNGAIAGLDDGRHVHDLNISPEFLNADGSLNNSLFIDALHPDAQGYQRWAGALSPLLGALLGLTPAPSFMSSMLPATSRVLAPPPSPVSPIIMGVLMNQNPSVLSLMLDLSQPHKDHSTTATS